MAVYRFKITFEDNEEVYREVEIKSTQNFEDFHNVIVQAIGFDNMHNASFFISDDYWRKGDEITLRPVEEDDNDDRRRRNQAPKKQMNKCKMASLIDDPHQKFVYVYDPKVAWTFLVELMKIVPDDPKASYPKVSKSAGVMPKQHKDNVAAAPSVDEEFDDDDEHHPDEEAYVNAHSEDETALLEGEEGEEEESAEPEEEQSESEEDEFGGGFEESSDERYED